MLKIAKKRYQSPTGDRAFTELVERHQQSLMGQVMASLSNYDLALEVLQESFLRAYRALPKCRDDTRVRAWLGRIAHNLCIDEIRRKKGERGSIRSIDQQDGDGLSLVNKLKSPSKDPSQLVLDSETKARIQESLNRLNSLSREIIQLRVYDELPYKEIALILDCSIGAAKQRMHQALIDLRKVFPESS
ncbi:MAG: RNA polymerase sigma factor [Planctomycetota bacterium]|nr:RNA polymerase sigma factor [Planctomycetota bacterium]